MFVLVTRNVTSFCVDRLRTLISHFLVMVSMSDQQTSVIMSHYNSFSYTNHCVKSVRVRSYSGPHFRAFGLNTETHSGSLRIQSECGEMPTRITQNTDTFHAVSNRCTFVAQSFYYFISFLWSPQPIKLVVLSFWFFNALFWINIRFDYVLQQI